MLLNTSLKDFIIVNYSQELLFAKYFGIDISELLFAIENGINLKNPLRNDTKPSLSFRYINEKLKMWDYGSFIFRGDIFDLVGLVIGKNANDSYEFVEICKYIISNNKTSNLDLSVNITPIKKESLITYISRPFNKFDISYFTSGKISKHHLIIRGVEAAKTASYNNKTYYENTTNNPLFVYNLGFDGERNIIKTYKPFDESKAYKFVSNSSYSIEGYEELYESEVLIITKSRKDKLVLESYIHNGDIVKKLGKLIRSLNIPPFITYPYINATYNPRYNINSKYCIINLQSESTLLNIDIIELLKKKHKTIIINYDYDLSGVSNAYYYYKIHGFIPKFIGRNSSSILNVIDDKLKDLIITKFKSLDIDSTFFEFESFIRNHAGNNEVKDFFELSELSNTKCENLINEYFR
jgi:hypothetical protein